VCRFLISIAKYCSLFYVHNRVVIGCFLRRRQVHEWFVEVGKNTRSCILFLLLNYREWVSMSCCLSDARVRARFLFHPNAVLSLCSFPGSILIGNRSRGKMVVHSSYWSWPLDLHFPSPLDEKTAWSTFRLQHVHSLNYHKHEPPLTFCPGLARCIS